MVSVSDAELARLRLVEQRARELADTAEWAVAVSTPDMARDDARRLMNALTESVVALRAALSPTTEDPR